jgi:predicted CoA-binding protein
MSTEQEILATYDRIVVVGASSLESKPAHWVSQYMLRQGYTIIPVNPDEDEVFGVPCYPNLAAVPVPVEFVNVFRRPEYCADVVREAVAVGAKVVWLQAGIVSEEARRVAEEAGLTFVQNRCVLQEHQRAGLGPIKAAIRTG